MTTLTQEISHASSNSPALHSEAQVLICLPSSSGDDHEATLSAIADAFHAESVLVASSECDPSPAGSSIECIAYQQPRSDFGWALGASDFAAAAALSRDSLRAIVLLANGNSLRGDALRKLADSILLQNTDLAVPRYVQSSGEGLVNTSIVYPLSRTLFGTDVRFPLAGDLALSPRMLARLSTPANRLVASGQSSALLWPVGEATTAGFAVRQVEDTQLEPVHAQDADFNSLFAHVAGSLFNDIETRASLWQRTRPITTPASTSPDINVASPSSSTEEIASMVEGFRIALANLQEIWSLVLPPQTRLALKKLSLLPAESFDFPPELWARIVYDFVLAFHARSINRGHLLGAMAPLYLAWAASQLRASEESEAIAARRITELTAAFDREKPYLVSRWRWPDRFNP